MDINGRMYGLIISEGQTYVYSIQALGSVSHQKNYFAKKKVQLFNVFLNL